MSVSVKPGSQNARSLVESLMRSDWLVPHEERNEILVRVAYFPTTGDVLQERWLAKIEVTNTCWLWTAGKHWFGHGTIALPGTRTSAYAHRLSYQWFVGTIPSHLEIDHVCCVPSCVNPTHLEAVTHAENVRRGRVAQIMGARTHCANGHPFAGDNVRPRSDSGRLCLTCKRETQRRYRERAGSLAA